MVKDYVEQRNGGYYVAGSRVSLDSVVYEFLDGASPESILQNFPALVSLESVYGAITFYLAHKQQIDLYLKEQEHQWEEAARNQSISRSDLERRLTRAVRKEALVTPSE
jgi:uncharacterized protein (DUF433 family)